MKLLLRITILVLLLAFLGIGRVEALSEERPPGGVILFKPGSAEITRDGTRTIDRLAALAKGDIANWVKLESCTLNRHSSAMSLAISQQRIDEIEHTMVLKGIPAHRVLGVNTLSTCHGDAGRVEIRIERLDHSK